MTALPALLFFFVVLTSWDPSSALCEDGPYGTCNSSSLPSPFCGISCTCSNLGPLDFKGIQANCSLTGSRGAAFVWIRSAAYRQGTAYANLRLGRSVLLANHSIDSMSYSTSVTTEMPLNLKSWQSEFYRSSSSSSLPALSSSTSSYLFPSNNGNPDELNNTLFINMSYVQLSNPSDVEFSIGGMPCVPYMSSISWNPLNFMFRAYWKAAEGMKANLFTLDVVQRNYSEGPEPQWKTIQKDFKKQVFATQFHNLQCEVVEIAFRTNLNISGVPSVPCAATSFAYPVYLRYPPKGAHVLNYTIGPAFQHMGQTVYNVTTLWMGASDLGGCSSVNYSLSFVAINSGQFFYNDVVSKVGSSPTPYSWIVPFAPLRPDIQYEFVFYFSSAAGQSDPVRNDKKRLGLGGLCEGRRLSIDVWLGWA